MSEASNNWNKTHTESCRISRRKWKLKNPLYGKEYAKRNKRKNDHLSRFGQRKNALNALERDNYTCQKCGMTNEEHFKKYKRRITLDHIDGNGRYSKIQNHALENLMTLCLPCHGRKDIKRRIYSNKKQ